LVDLRDERRSIRLDRKDDGTEHFDDVITLERDGSVLPLLSKLVGALLFSTVAILAMFLHSRKKLLKTFYCYSERERVSE
jgi:hypothetical protein